ncbi:MAG: GspE/PulE family protein [Candidatus Gracilibacteria bacterium]|jgi:type IV pilus assembly protein PilB
MQTFDEQLAELLLNKKLITDKALETVKRRAEAQEISLEAALFDLDVIPVDDLGQVLAQVYQVPFVKLSDKTIPEALLPVVPYRLAQYQNLVPFEQKDGELHVAFNNPKNYELINFLENKTGLSIVPYYATKSDLSKALKVYNRDINQKFSKLLTGKINEAQTGEPEKDSSKIVDTVILFAYQNNASDIHIEPHKEFVMVRYRIDGILSTIAELPIEIAELIVSRIKVLAKLRTDEHRAAQDGRIKIDLESNEITLRVSIVPVYDGEKVVMRILSSVNQELDLEALGYSKQNLDTIQSGILKTFGIILVTGPTGSGKTTTLYTVLKLLNSPEVNISTIEDPIEYRLEGINQIQVNAKTNLTFANGLRALLRQDPDIVMIGEIRDEETAGIAINAALTGHLVLATLHTNDAATTLPRMLEMGVASYLLSATAKLVVAQRLVRKICEKCKTSYALPTSQLNDFAKKFKVNEDLKVVLAEVSGGVLPETLTLYKGAGCEFCHNSGFKGRTGISEVMEVSDQIQKAILDNESSKVLEGIARKEGMKTIFMDGLDKVLKGMTTLEEVLRVMRS